MFQVDQIDHIALNVRDLDAAVAWYKDVLGLERRFADVWEPPPVALAAGNTWIAFFPADSSSPGNANPRSTGMRHVAFRVSRTAFQEAQTRLTARGIAFDIEDHEVALSLYFHDPDGNQLELTTYDIPLLNARDSGSERVQ